MSLSFSQQTLAQLFIRQRRALVGMLARIVGNRQTAEDLAQEAYVRVAIAEREQPIGALQAFLALLDGDPQRRAGETLLPARIGALRVLAPFGRPPASASPSRRGSPV